jgi:hypothetical protein
VRLECSITARVCVSACWSCCLTLFFYLSCRCERLGSSQHGIAVLLVALATAVRAVAPPLLGALLRVCAAWVEVTVTLGTVHPRAARSAAAGSTPCWRICLSRRRRRRRYCCWCSGHQKLGRRQRRRGRRQREQHRNGPCPQLQRDEVLLLLLQYLRGRSCGRNRLHQRLALCLFSQLSCGRSLWP